MKIVVCGDSFCSADSNRPGTHFSELIGMNGHEVINLARGGMSNIGIAFQIREAILFKADLIIFNTTCVRLNIPTGKQKFRIEQGLKNFCYPYTSDLSSRSPWVGRINAPIWADSAESIINSRLDAPKNLNLSAEQMDAVKKYLTYLHEYNFLEVIDEWVIEYWKIQIRDAGIKMIELSRTGIGKSMYLYASENPTLVAQAVYHTDYETQQKVCEEILQHIEQFDKRI